MTILSLRVFVVNINLAVSCQWAVDDLKPSLKGIGGIWEAIDGRV